MIKKLALAVLVVALGSVTAMAADFNGKWSADVPGRNGNSADHIHVYGRPRPQ